MFSVVSANKFKTEVHSQQRQAKKDTGGWGGMQFRKQVYVISKFYSSHYLNKCPI